MSRDIPQQRITTHPRRRDRQARAKALHERMAADPRSVTQREHERGHHKNCDHSAMDLLESIFRNQASDEEFEDMVEDRPSGPRIGDSTLEPWA